MDSNLQNWHYRYPLKVMQSDSQILGSRDVDKRKLFETVTPFRLRMKKCSVSTTGNLGQVAVTIDSISANRIYSFGENVINCIVQRLISGMINCSVYRTQCTIKCAILWKTRLSIEWVRFFIDCSKTWIGTTFWLTKRIFVFFLVQRETQISNFERLWLQLTSWCFQLVAQLLTFPLNNIKLNRKFMSHNYESRLMILKNIDTNARLSAFK